VKSAQEEDAMLATAMKEHGATAILLGLERSTVSDGRSELLVEREIQPLALFKDSAAVGGAFTVPRGGPVYGYWRRIPGFEATPSLPDEANRLWRSLNGDRSPDSAASPAFQYLWLYGPPGSVETISARDILIDEIPESIRSTASGSVAFVGASDPNTADFPDAFPSFFRKGIGAGISGVELIATAFLNLSANESMSRVSTSMEWTATALFAFTLGFVARTRSGLGLLAAPVAAVLCLAGASYAFANARIFLPIGTMIFFVAPMGFLTAVVVKYRFTRKLIMHLAPAPVARRMLARGTDQRAELVSDDATVVFFDLIGSSAIAEKLAPVEFSTLLNSFLETVTAMVERHGGFVGGFTGDGLLAVFTRSDAGLSHAAHACKSTLSVVRGIEALNSRHAEHGFPALHFRVGLNSGNIAEGEIGARDRFNFSVVGDVVNLAARLEQLGKTLFPGEREIILAGEASYRLAEKHGLVFADCGLCRIPGRERVERVYRLLVNMNNAGSQS
jgi:adenylate cyclase